MPLNPMFPPPRPDDPELVSHYRVVSLYAAARGIPPHQALDFFNEDQRAARVLHYIRAHPGVSAEEADRIVAAGDAGRR